MSGEQGFVSEPRRVKVYQLDKDQHWEDKGTGHCVYYQRADEAELLVKSEEESNEVLLSSKIDVNREYSKQQETLIVWIDESQNDLALSFQEPEGCAEIWNLICEVQKENQIRQNARARQDHRWDDQPDSPTSHSNGLSTIFPPPEMGNLKEIESLVQQISTSLYERDRAASFIVQDQYIPKLISVFEMCEDLENIDDLHTLCNIFQHILLFNDNHLIEQVIQDDIVLGAVGILEYDPEYPTLKANHREYLANNTKFKQVVPIKDKAVEAKIHQAFRLQYLKDVVLVRVLDDSTINTINSLIQFNQSDIINHIQNDSEFLSQLFGVLQNDSAPIEKKRDVIMFVQQFCQILKNPYVQNRAGAFRALSHHGLFGIFEYALKDDDRATKTAGAEILVSVLEHDPNLVRSYALAQVKEDGTPKSQKPLCETLVQQVIAENDLGLKGQYAEAIRVLLETQMTLNPIGSDPLLPRERQDPEVDEFLQLFYDKYMMRLLQPLLDIPKEDIPLKGPMVPLVSDRETSALHMHLCELLCFCLRQHGWRVKNLLLQKDVLKEVAQLFRCREQYLKLAAIRLIRTVISVCDEFYNRYLIKEKIIEGIVRVFLDTDGKDNLVNSACLEFFDRIRKENMKLLVAHLMTYYDPYFKDIKYVQTFERLASRHEQNIEPSANYVENDPLEPVIPLSVKGAWSSSTLDSSEQSYFDKLDEEEAEQPVISDASKPHPDPTPKPLVDYEEDDEESTAKAKDPMPPKRRHDEEDEEEMLLGGAKRMNQKMKIALPSKLAMNKT